ncbi:response regulator [Paludisphaera soli]|uniref:response regulator n=1 Tax=Paludisphaera soli TaxID=2712865 RepID=UPI0013EC7F3C|nr:response regulator [Paludisphaera soli]
MMIDTERCGPRPRPAASTDEGPRTPRLLVVDDSEFERRRIAVLLGGFEGLDVGFAPGAAEALEELERDPPDLLLSDLVMPEMDGLELARRVHEARPGLPVILMTAFGGEQEAVRALRSGASDYLPKSRLDKDLTPTLRRALDAFAFDLRRHRLARGMRSQASTYELDNDPELASMLAQVLVDEVAGLGLLDRSARIRLRVALQEALLNALFHGNLELGSELRREDEAAFHAHVAARRVQEPYRSRRIRVRVVLDRRAAVFEIEDQGPGFDVRCAGRPVEPEDLKRVGGRGLMLMRTFMDEVSHNSRGNVVTMTMRLDAGRSPG